MDKIKVKKANGQIEDFSEDKVRQSLKRSGATPKVTNRILSQLIGKLYQGITTKEIYQQVYQLFDQHQSQGVFRYSLKNSLMQLGPSGYPFEKFIARLLTQLGYTTSLPDIIKGKCISHEVDVVAKKDSQVFMIECKFHNRAGTKTRSKEALYTQARFEDLSNNFTKPWLITNTKLTSNAIKYATCRGMKLLAWKYPRDYGLERLIEDNHLFPITCLNFLNSHDRQLLYQNNLVLLNDLFKVDDSKLEHIGLNSGKIAKIRSFFDRE